MLDVEPAAPLLAGLVEAVCYEQLTAPEPCVEASLGDLLGHAGGVAVAFTAAAANTLLRGGSQAPCADVPLLHRVLGLTGRDPAWHAGI